MFKNSTVDSHLRVESNPSASAWGPAPLALFPFLQPYPAAIHRSGYFPKWVSCCSSSLLFHQPEHLPLAPRLCSLSAGLSWVTSPGKPPWPPKQSSHFRLSPYPMCALFLCLQWHCCDVYTSLSWVIWGLGRLLIILFTQHSSSTVLDKCLWSEVGNEWMWALDSHTSGTSALST